LEQRAMIEAETADEAKDVLNEVVDDQERSAEDWSQVEEEMRSLEQAIEAGDEEGARSAVERLGRRGLKLGGGGKKSPDAIQPSDDIVAIKNKIVDKL
jgi:hypothetical protein